MISDIDTFGLDQVDDDIAQARRRLANFSPLRKKLERVLLRKQAYENPDRYEGYKDDLEVVVTRDKVLLKSDRPWPPRPTVRAIGDVTEIIGDYVAEPLDGDSDG